MKSLAVRIASLAIAAWAVAPAPHAAAPGLDGWAGVYKRSFKNSDISGETFVTENVLEIAPVSQNEAYFRTRLWFFNGHFCALYGIAQLEKGVLIYRSKKRQFGSCELKLMRRQGALVFEDNDHACGRGSCGARGMLDGQGFPLSTRRPIRYMPRLKASREYAEALDEAGLRSPAPNAAP